MRFNFNACFLLIAALVISLSGLASGDVSQWKQWLEESPSPEHSYKIYELSKNIGETDPVLSNEVIDQLLQYSGLSENDSLMVYALLVKAENFIKLNEEEKAETQLKQALRFTENHSNLHLQALVLYQLGVIQINRGDAKKAWLYFQTADKLTITFPHSKLAIQILMGQATCRLIENNLIDSKSFTDSALVIALQLNYQSLASSCYIQLANIAKASGDFLLAQTVLNQAFDILLPKANTQQAISILLNQQQTALQLGDSIAAMNYLVQALELQRSVDQQQRDIQTQNQTKILSNYLNNQPVNYFWPGIFFLILVIAISATLGIIRWLGKKKASLENQVKSLEEQQHTQESILIDMDEAVEEEVEHTLKKGEEELIERQNNYPKLEDALEFSKQADYLKDMFLAKLSHEVRSPLTTILGFSSLLETELAMMEDPELFEFASNITQSGQSLIELLNNIFDLSLINSNKLELKISPFNIELTTQELIKKYESSAIQRGIRIVVSPCEMEQMESDKGLIERILSMIIDNSVRFTEKGYIKIDINLDKKKNLVSIQVKDTGVGIDKAYIKDVFEPYRKEKLGYSTLYQGAGLSLPLTKKMVEILGGSIQIESEKGIGTSVFLTIPLIYSSVKEEKNVSYPQKKKELNTDGKLKSVLLIEPDDLNNLIIKKFLKKTCVVTAVYNTEEAMVWLQDSKTKKKPFDLIFLDIPTQQDPNITHFLHFIKSDKNAEIKSVIGLASDPNTPADNHFMDLGLTTFVIKPILREQLDTAVKKVLNSG